MHRLHQVLLAAAFSIGLVGSAGAASTVCTGHDALVASLGQEYGEFRHAVGLTDGGLLMEVFVSPEGSWTILLTTPAGLACVTAFGDAWETVPPPEPGAST